MPTSNDDVLKEIKELKKALDEIKSQQTEMHREMSQAFTLFTDRFTWMDTSLNAMRVTAALYAPPQQPVGPTGGYLTEPRSRWKQTWYFSR